MIFLKYSQLLTGILCLFNLRSQKRFLLVSDLELNRNIDCALTMDAFGSEEE